MEDKLCKLFRVALILQLLAIKTVMKQKIENAWLVVKHFDGTTLKKDVSDLV